MSHRYYSLTLLVAAGILMAAAPRGWADAPKENKPTAANPAAQPKHPTYDEVLANAETVDGFIKLHQKNMRLYAELSPGDLNKDLMVAIAIARGIGQQPLLGGMTWGFGDNWIWQFRKVDDRIQIVRRNVRFRAASGTPQAKAVHLAYTDSIMFSLPIVTKSSSGNFVVDLTPVFMSDLPRISAVLQGFNFAADRSSWAAVKGFKDNVTIEVAATYAGGRNIETVADARGVTLYIHYSVSRLPQTGYQPRLADDRVGHFLTVIKDYSKTGQEDQFVRYVNRWDLRKVEPSAAVSPPTKPIIFWIEKTVPYKFRGAVRAGILEWNKAFERAGFSNAIEVRQQPDDATWDPEDINYNTFRWITASAGFAMGPSRVNPLTGEILDADIIFDADFIEKWTQMIEAETPGAAIPLPRAGNSAEGVQGIPSLLRHDHEAICDYSRVMGEQLAFGSMALGAGGKTISKEQLEKLFIDGVKSVVTHEVGHTLGLRHNFKSSAYLTMEDISNPEKTADVGLAASVMDYVPVNISPKGKKQGDYFSRTIGPYDYWAIEYAYKPISGGADAEKAALAKIASRGTEPALQYATDEDIGTVEPDPLVNRFDLSSDPVEFARWRVELIDQLLPGLIDEIVEPGDDYYRAHGLHFPAARPHAGDGVCRTIHRRRLCESRPQRRSERAAAVCHRRTKETARSPEVPQPTGLRPRSLPVSHQALQLPRLVALEPLGHEGIRSARLSRA